MLVLFAYLKESIAHHRCRDFLTQKCIITNKMTTIENLQLDFDLEEFIDTTVLLIGYSYKIQTLPAHHREEYVVFINEKGNYTFY